MRGGQARSLTPGWSVISTGTVNALVTWASGNSDRIAQLTAERDALVAAFLSGGKSGSAITAASGNGKSFTFLPTASREEKLSVLTNVLTQLGAIPAGTGAPSISYGNFSGIER